MAVRLAHWGRTVALDLGNFDLVGRCSVNEAYNYVHAGRVRVTLRMIKVKRADARIRGDALLVNMCQRADSFSRRVGQAMMSKGGFEGGEGPHDNGGGTGGGGGGGGDGVLDARTRPCRTGGELGGVGDSVRGIKYGSAAAAAVVVIFPSPTNAKKAVPPVAAVVIAAAATRTADVCVGYPVNRSNAAVERQRTQDNYQRIHMVRYHARIRK